MKKPQNMGSKMNIAIAERNNSTVKPGQIKIALKNPNPVIVKKQSNTPIGLKTVPANFYTR